jgi:hypothetical protein
VSILSSDTIFVVVHERAKRALKAKGSELVDNSAARYKGRGVPTAKAQTLSKLSGPSFPFPSQILAIFDVSLSVRGL